LKNITQVIELNLILVIIHYIKKLKRNIIILVKNVELIEILFLPFQLTYIILMVCLGIIMREI